jgi:hypothetical protein
VYAKDIPNGIWVRPPGIGAEFEIGGYTISQLPEHNNGVMTVSLANTEGWNELGVTVNSNESVSVPELFGIVVCEPSLFLANVTPNLVKLNPFGVYIDKVLIHDQSGAFSGSNHKTYDGIAVDSSNSFNRTNRIALYELRQDEGLLVIG